MRYLLLDESAYPADELEPLDNLAAALFRMERKGMQQGTQEGEAVFFIRLLEKRFGPLAPRTVARIKATEPEQPFI